VTVRDKIPPTGPRPAVFSIGPGTPFVDALAAGLLARHGTAADSLASLTILLPTRRACRALREAFLRRSAGAALILPRLAPLGDVEEDELALAGWEEEADPAPWTDDVPPAISPIRRHALLTRLVQAIGDGAATADQAARLAGELGRLLDQVQTERLGFDRLAELVPAEFAAHWQITLEFLRILSARWPEILAEEGCCDPAERRTRLLAKRAEAWRRNPPADPIVAAGSTGSIPATADLLAVIATLPAGCIVLPGLTRDADRRLWEEMEPSHPQFGMARLLARLKVAPAEVAEWPAPDVASPGAGRGPAIARALCPAAATAEWRTLPPLPEDALSGVTRIDCPTPREEAGVIALALREVLETPERTGALVTPDRRLARRVAAELRRWGIEIDDSGGRPLGETTPMVFLRLVSRMVVEDFAPVPLLAALKHPLAGGGLAPGRFRAAVRRLEIRALRGPRPAAGIDGIRHVAGVGKAVAAVLGALEYAAAPFRELAARGEAPFGDLVHAHLQVGERLSATDTEEGASRLWAGEAGEAAAAFMDEVLGAASALGPVPAGDYPALLDALLAAAVVRPRYGRHPRLRILGLLEARLQQSDLLVLGGLNEGTWPPEARPSPWMSRPMMGTFGLPLPERRIGLAAHDFAQAFCAPRVLLTRALRVEGTPTVPSRWLTRLETLVRGTPLEDALRSRDEWLGWFAGLDDPPAVRPVDPPAPRPPIGLRPRALSVTRIETWIRDPYAIFAREILRLRPLDAIDADPGAAERGSVIHKILERFFAANGGPALPADALDRLLDIGRATFAELGTGPAVRAFWWPRFARAARWFVDFDRRWRAAGGRPLASEVSGVIEIDAPRGPFRLTARADRIDRLDDSRLAILDYKTGQTPTWPQVKSGLAPQLALEAAIACAGGFEGIAAAEVARLVYVRLSGGRTPGEDRVLADDVATLAADTRAGLARLVAAYDDPETAYRARLRPMLEGRPGDYDHLSRLKEWSTRGEAES
jgi:ATP-dependent helicase/nuclease subunit B